MSLVQIKSSSTAAANRLAGRQYWRSLEQLAGTPEFQGWLHREFPEGASEMPEASSRRTLLKLMAASFGLAGLTACRRPEERILPAAKGVEDLIPGKPAYYATSMTLGGVATGVLAESHDGRPTKIEGNPNHPSSLGAASAYEQASVLDLYDPDRSRHVLRDGKRAGWEDFVAFAREHFTESNLGQGAGVWLLSERVSAPSLAAVRDHFLRRFPAARWVEYDPVSRDAAYAGAEIAFGRKLEAHYDLSKADVVVSLDADFLGVDAPSLAGVRAFTMRRDADGGPGAMNRLYVAESQFSITGAMADHRARLRSADVLAFARGLGAALGVSGATGGDERHAGRLRAMAADLKARAGRSVVMAGPRQPAAVHALAALLNEALGNIGPAVVFTEPASGGSADSIRDLAAAMASGEANTVVILGGNPVYNAPADTEFATNFAKVAARIHLGMHADETAALAAWHVPQAHYLEAWGDGRAVDGTVSMQQPLIQPLYDGKTPAELLALLGGYPDQRAYDIVRNYWTRQWTSGDAEKAWRRALPDGVIADTAFAAAAPAVNAARVMQALEAAAAPGGGIEIVFHQSPSVYDGRFANNGWQQELPDPMTKLTWDNAALVSPRTAGSLQVKNGEVIRIERAGRSIELPVFIVPGQADDSIALELGYGRRVCGRVGTGVGHDVYPLRTSDAMGFATGVTAAKTGRRYPLATAQDHHSMEGRPLVREATAGHYREHPEFAKHAVHHPPLESLYEHPVLDGEYQWGMAIDLNRCTGCNACVVACQAENNIPIVGKEEVARGREMHWIRLDRYFTGGEEDPQAVVQPVGCQHCENAPCENVCPVAATVHTPEGLNAMAYNRCVGTRYCSNNCPYKVRRFNFLDWHGEVAETRKMVFNPDVTVRMRGVMEKCTYCVQRIEEKKIEAKAQGRKVIDGEIKTACQQTCPAEAIVFGNIADPESRVSKLKAQARDYAMLAELNVKPRTSYLAKLRNPNPELESHG